MMKILVTAFEPFGGQALNASMEALALVRPQKVEAQLYQLILPVAFEQAFERLVEGIERYAPDVVLCLGEAGGRGAITPERVAINWLDARIPDNAGQMPKDQPIDPQGPAAYFSSLPVREMVEAITQAGLPATVSLSAGSFVCNELMYRLLHHIDRQGLALRGGFMHLPLLREQAQGPGFEARQLADAVEQALGVLAAQG